MFGAVSVAALSQSRTLFELGLVVVLAAAAPLIAQVLRLPSILVLLAFGFGAGAIGALDPNALLGENLISGTVSIAEKPGSTARNFLRIRFTIDRTLV